LIPQIRSILRKFINQKLSDTQPPDRHQEFT